MKTAIRLFFFLTVLTSSAQSLKVMTYNIRYDNPGDGINQWQSRKQKVFDLLKKYDPDFIGVQEALNHQMEDIKTNITSYAYVGVGRDDGKKQGEYSGIFYKKDLFEVVTTNTFWLSEKPDVPGSKSWDAAITRIATVTHFKDKKTQKEFLFINTHFDHVGKEARKRSAMIIKELSHSFLPVIITGDFNCTRAEDPYKIIVGPVAEKKQTLFDPAPSNPTGTFCSFQVNSIECRPIDYIFHTENWRAENYKVIQDNDGVSYPSDHLPVMVELTLLQK